MAKGSDPKDPRFTRFRRGAYGVYIVVVSVFSGLIVFSIFRSVLQMSPRPPAEVEQTLTTRECVDGAEALWRKLDDKRKAFTAERPAEQVDADFSKFRTAWIKNLRDLQAKCAVESRTRGELRTLFRRLDKLSSLYTTHAVQFAGEVGPEVDRLQESFAAARKEASGR